MSAQCTETHFCNENICDELFSVKLHSFLCRLSSQALLHGNLCSAQQVYRHLERFQVENVPDFAIVVDVDIRLMFSAKLFLSPRASFCVKVINLGHDLQP